jgi:hypothetical protein
VAGKLEASAIVACASGSEGEMASKTLPIRGRVRKKGSRGCKGGRWFACTSLLCQLEFVLLIVRDPMGSKLSLYKVDFLSMNFIHQN